MRLLLFASCIPMVFTCFYNYDRISNRMIRHDAVIDNNLYSHNTFIKNNTITSSKKQYIYRTVSMPDLKKY